MHLTLQSSVKSMVWFAVETSGSFCAFAFKQLRAKVLQPLGGGAKRSMLIWPHWPVVIGRCHSRSFTIGCCNFRAAGIQVSWWDRQRTKTHPQATDCIWQRCGLVSLCLSVSLPLPYQRVPSWLKLCVVTILLKITVSSYSESNCSHCKYSSDARGALF